MKILLLNKHSKINNNNYVRSCGNNYLMDKCHNELLQKV